ncbi:MAG: hypothetical protein GOMPHAMPRED_000984 [Gomphillus americanus]|uniref:N-alpha-acetyltransferase 40 n=1 Tax=Gomphillus americanus TaxID=1940652 RepID=A0A8H3F3C1_9LECA|nr:MAG: hypothetical protein GOMPHAMPRED_000984 [Gomphillus americanus]
MSRKLDPEGYNTMSLDAFKKALLKNVGPNCKSKATHYSVTLETASTINQEDFDACFDLIAYTSKLDYELSTTRWNPKAKKKEMKLANMRYLLVRDQIDPGVLGFASFMLTYEAGKEVVYLYEIHLADKLRNLGIGKQLINMVSQIGQNAGVEKIMLTVFVRNSHATEWYTRLGFTLDEFWPEARTLRSGPVKQTDYRILSRPVS